MLHDSVSRCARASLLCPSLRCGRSVLTSLLLHCALHAAEHLNQYLAALTKISSIYNIAIFITNQVTADPGASAMFGDTKKVS